MPGLPIELSRSGLTQRARPIIDIILADSQREAFMPTYTTLDKIEGTVSITAICDFSFQDILITFQGASRTYVEAISATTHAGSRTQAAHHFLKLFQPINPSKLPSDRIAKAGQTYEFPFTFVVPDRLLPQACSHCRDNDVVSEAHLTLPPTFGDRMTMSSGGSLSNDLAPDMTQISYALKVIITRQPGSSGKASILDESIKKVRIIPAMEEQPPLSVPGGKDDTYTLRKEKVLKRGIFKGRLGRLIIEAAQPKSLRLSTPGRTSACPTSTMAILNLRFDPAEESAHPPRLGSLVNKLKVSTLFATLPIGDVPTRLCQFMQHMQRGVYSETIALSCRNVESAPWTVHDASISSDRSRKQACTNLVDISCESTAPETQMASKFYTSQILVPISLPTSSKTFVPTFHSCLVSRIYVLDISLSVSTVGKTISPTVMHLKLPVQVSSEGNPYARPTISEAEAQAIAAREADFDLQPRSVAPPSPEYTEQAENVHSMTRDARSDTTSPPMYSAVVGIALGR